MSKIEQWHSQEFLPWQKQKEEYDAAQQEMAKLLVNQAAQLKYVVALLYDGQLEQARQAWNAMGIGQPIKSISLTASELELELQNGTTERIALASLVAELTQELRRT